jgi:ElaB/YqjD/DUF883 family membrane-anchored ribosome-binding protein
MTQYQSYATEEGSDAIRADIERTRSTMGNRIDQIQERVNPEHLRHQAQDAVRTAVHEGTDAVVGYVREHAPDFGSAVFDVIKRNPVPAALIGVGAGWLLYESLSGHSKPNGGSYQWRSPANYDVGGYETGGYEYEDQYRGSRFSAQYGYNPETYNPSAYGWSSEQEHTGGGMVGQVRHQAEQVAETVGEKVGQMTGAVSDTFGQVRHQAEQVAETVGDKVGQVAGKAQELGSQVSHLSTQARHQAQQVGGQVSHLGGQTRHQLRQAGSQAQHLVETNPLTLSLAAFAIGAAIGLALPPTRRESQVMGQWRDQVMEKAQTVASDVKQRVQEVVEEVKPELQQVATMAVEDVKETGKAALTEAKDVLNRAKETIKSDLSEATSESGEESNNQVSV